jgi:hypothetical protein
LRCSFDERQLGHPTHFARQWGFRGPSATAATSGSDVDRSEGQLFYDDGHGSHQILVFDIRAGIGSGHECSMVSASFPAS